MANLQVVNIVIKAYLPTGKTLDEQFEALSKVKAAHASGDYSELLKSATIEEVKTEQKTRRIEDAPAPSGANSHGIGPDTDGGENPDYQGELSAEDINAAEAGPVEVGAALPDAPMASDDWAKPLSEEEKESIKPPAQRGRKAA